MNIQPTNLTVANAPLPATYEAAKKALAACAALDECQDWANKAEAMASYAKQAKDKALHDFADRIQGRAKRRLGDLLKLYDGRGRPEENREGTHPNLSQAEAAKQAGISEHQRKQAVRISNIPEAEFEAAIESDHPATVTKLAEMGKKAQPTPIDPAAKQGFANFKKFAEFCEMNSPSFIASAVPAGQMQEARKQVSKIDAWLDHFVVGLN